MCVNAIAELNAISRWESDCMTVREFYEWAKRNDCLDFEVEIQHRDDGGYYSGTDELRESEIEIDREKYSGVVTI